MAAVHGGILMNPTPAQQCYALTAYALSLIGCAISEGKVLPLKNWTESAV